MTPLATATDTRVVREWRAATTPDRVPAYRHHLIARVLPGLEALPGFLGLRMLTRAVDEGVEIVVQTTWRALADIEAFAGADLTRAVVEPEAQAVLVRFDTVVRHDHVAHEG